MGTSKRIQDIHTAASGAIEKEPLLQEKEPPIRQEHVQKIIDYIKEHKLGLRNKAVKGRKHYRMFALPFQIELPKGKATSPDELIIVIHLKPESPQEFKGRERNVEVLGEGAFKSVRHSLQVTGFSSPRPRVEYAATGTLRSTRKGRHLDEEAIQEAITEMNHEVRMLKFFEGKRGIVQCIGHCIYPVKTKISQKWYGKIWEGIFGGRLKMNMVMTYGTSLDKMPNIQENRKKYTLDLLHGLSTVHSKRIVHADIKPKNILVSAKDEALLADFGSAYFLEKGGRVKGTPAYFAPELFLAIAYNRRRDLENFENVKASIGTPHDVYSLGLVLYQMKHDKLPEDLQVSLNNDHLQTFKVVQAWHKEQTEKLHSVDYNEYQTLDISEKMEIINGIDDEDQREEALILEMLNPRPRNRIPAANALEEFTNLYH